MPPKAVPKAKTSTAKSGKRAIPRWGQNIAGTGVNNPLSWSTHSIITVHPVPRGFRLVAADGTITSIKGRYREYRFTSITAQWQPLYNHDVGTACLLPFYDTDTAPHNLASMITSGGVLRNGSNTFTKVASGQGEIQSASIVTPGAVPLTYTPLQGGVAVYSAAKSTFTGDVGWVKIVWIYQARLPLEGTTSLANPTLP